MTTRDTWVFVSAFALGLIASPVVVQGYGALVDVMAVRS